MLTVIKKFIALSAVSAMCMSTAFAAPGYVHFGAKTPNVNDVSIMNYTNDVFTVVPIGHPSEESYGTYELGTTYPANSLWIDFGVYGGIADDSVCVTIIRNADSAVYLNGCGFGSGSSIPVQYSATFKPLPKK